LGYPTSVFAPASRSNGQTIDAAHTNDLQDEVAAVENALLGTITHSVNITGASTLATLQCAGSTFSVRPVTPPPEALRVTIDSTLAVASGGTSTGINWLASAYLTNSSMHSTGTNSSRLTPQSTGVYVITAEVRFTFNSSGYRRIQIRDSSQGVIGGVLGFPSTVDAGMVMQASAYKRFDELGGYVMVAVEQDGASTLSLSNDAWVEMHKL